MITVVLVLIIVAFVAIFSVQNATPVAISFFFWKFEASLAIVIFLSVLSGILITVIALSSRSIRRSLKKETRDVSRGSNHARRETEEKKVNARSDSGNV